MVKTINKVTTLPIAHVKEKLNEHIEKQNVDGWELMNAALENIGIEEVFILFWKRTVECITLPDGKIAFKVDGYPK